MITFVRALRGRAGLAATVPLLAVSMLAAANAGAAARSANVRERASLERAPLPGTHCPAFPADNVWNTPINTLPVNRHSAAWVKAIGTHYQGRLIHTHPDFGPSYGAQPVPYGIPITYVSGSHPKVHVRFMYASESDRVRYPLGSDTKIEGGKNASGDRHAIVVDTSTCKDYETWLTRKKSAGWTAGSGAVFSLSSNKLRPKGWTSADAAGLPILPGLLRWNEVKAGHVDHAIRFTAPCTAPHFIWPARHHTDAPHPQYCLTSSGYPPMGARFRLKASYRLPHASHYAQVVIKAMKTYGLILADNGSSWYFQGEQSRHWPDNFIVQMKEIPSTAFQAVDESGLEISPGSAQARQPR